MNDDSFTHHCQPLDDAEDELHVVALIKAMRPYLLSSPPPTPIVRIPQQRRVEQRVSERNTEQRIRNLQAMTSRPKAEGHL